MRLPLEKLLPLNFDSVCSKLRLQHGRMYDKGESWMDMFTPVCSTTNYDETENSVLYLNFQKSCHRCLPQESRSLIMKFRGHKPQNPN